MIFFKYHTSRTIYQPFDNFDSLVVFIHFPASFIFFQGEPGLHGVKGIRGEPGHKGDRGPLGLPVSTAVHHGISPATKPCPLFPQTFIEISHFLCLDLLNFLLCISAHILSVCVVCAVCVCVRVSIRPPPSSVLISMCLGWAPCNTQCNLVVVNPAINLS